MPDPFTGWLSYVVALLGLIATASVSLKIILHNADHMLGSVLSMCDRVRRFRHRRSVTPGARRKPKISKGTCGNKDSSAST
jgi:hypothetical protein